MGGFEGGDEAGFWENDALLHIRDTNKPNPRASLITKTDIGYSIKAPAKINIFLKITGHQEGYHTLLSRFMRVEDLYDTLTFVPCECDSFTIEGCEGIPLESNTIYKAYKALNEYTGDLDILNFFYQHKVVVEKRIPSQAGLGGGSSDAASFMLLVKEVCNLLISTKELAKLGSTIGADLPFFIYQYPSANVSGFGEIVTPFEEEPLSFEITTPKVGCDTAEVYRHFKNHFLSTIDPRTFAGWEHIDSRTLLTTYSDPKQLNDLYRAALIAYPELEVHTPKGWYFSGSGSSFFRLRNA